MATNLDSLLQQLLRERKYLRNVSPETIEWYETAWKAFQGSATSCLTDLHALKRSDLEQFIYVLRDRGVKPVTCNTWLRALNAFFRWLHENGHISTRIHMKPLKAEKRLVETLDAETIRDDCELPVADGGDSQQEAPQWPRRVRTRSPCGDVLSPFPSSGATILGSLRAISSGCTDASHMWQGCWPATGADSADSLWLCYSPAGGRCGDSQGNCDRKPAAVRVAGAKSARLELRAVASGTSTNASAVRLTRPSFIPNRLGPTPSSSAKAPPPAEPPDVTNSLEE